MWRPVDKGDILWVRLYDDMFMFALLKIIRGTFAFLGFFKVRGTFTLLGFHSLIVGWGEQTERSELGCLSYVVVQVTCGVGVNVASESVIITTGVLRLWLTGAKNRSSSSHGAVGFLEVSTVPLGIND